MGWATELEQLTGGQSPKQEVEAWIKEKSAFSIREFIKQEMLQRKMLGHVCSVEMPTAYKNLFAKAMGHFFPAQAEGINQQTKSTGCCWHQIHVFTSHIRRGIALLAARDFPHFFTPSIKKELLAHCDATIRFLQATYPDQEDHDPRVNDGLIASLKQGNYHAFVVGWPTHALGLAFFNNQCVLINGGPRPDKCPVIKAITIDRGKITRGLFQTILNRNVGYQEFRRLGGLAISPEKLAGNISFYYTTLIKALGGRRDETCELIESLSPKRDQQVGNCTEYSQRMMHYRVSSFAELWKQKGSCPTEEDCRAIVAWARGMSLDASKRAIQSYIDRHGSFRAKLSLRMFLEEDNPTLPSDTLLFDRDILAACVDKTCRRIWNLELKESKQCVYNRSEGDVWRLNVQRRWERAEKIVFGYFSEIQHAEGLALSGTQQVRYFVNVYLPALQEEALMLFLHKCREKDSALLELLLQKPTLKESLIKKGFEAAVRNGDLKLLEFLWKGYAEARSDEVMRRALELCAEYNHHHLIKPLFSKLEFCSVPEEFWEHFAEQREEIRELFRKERDDLLARRLYNELFKHVIRKEFGISKQLCQDASSKTLQGVLQIIPRIKQSAFETIKKIIHEVLSARSASGIRS